MTFLFCLVLMLNEIKGGTRLFEILKCHCNCNLLVTHTCTDAHAKIVMIPFP